MKDEIIAAVKELFEQNAINGFVALREGENGHIGPYVFTDPSELDQLSLGDRDKPGDARYPLASLVSCLADADPEAVYAVLVRGCDERALYHLMNEESRVTPLRRDQVIMVGFSCPQELGVECQCHKPWPDHLTAGDRTPAPPPPYGQERGDDILEELDFWYKTFERCIKCFGCRNVCPVCACKECTIEREVLVPQRELPPGPNFLMTRAVHMVGACVYCGLCEQTCPADIPLKDLYRFAAKVIGQGGVLPGTNLPMAKE
jgi:ferredoxin